MTTLVIEDNSVQARQFIKFVRTLPFVTVRKEKAIEREPEFNLYESLNSAFTDVKLMVDGKKPKTTGQAFLEEIRKEKANGVYNSNN